MRIWSVVFIALFSANTSFAKDKEEHHWQDTPHHLSALLGITYTRTWGNAFTVGVDYEYRVNDFLGVGVVAEYAGEDFDAYTLILVADLHITNSAIVQIGPGVEFHGSHKMEVVRVGALYEMEMSGFTFSPQLHYDYHRNHKSALVAGFAIGFSF